MGGYEVTGDQGLLASASNGSLSGANQGGFLQENVQYAAYGSVPGNPTGQVPPDQQGGFMYQQTAYSSGSTAEGQQYGGKCVNHSRLNQSNI